MMENNPRRSTKPESQQRAPVESEQTSPLVTAVDESVKWAGYPHPDGRYRILDPDVYPALSTRSSRPGQCEEA